MEGVQGGSLPEAVEYAPYGDGGTAPRWIGFKDMVTYDAAFNAKQKPLKEKRK